MEQKLLYIVPVKVTAKLPVDYQPCELFRPTVEVARHKLEHISVTFKNPTKVTISGTVITSASNLDDAIFDIVDNGWCRLHHGAISILLNDVTVDLDDGVVLTVDVDTGEVVKKPVSSLSALL
ncbi:hypothetical protein GCM10011332_30700 [Terasakiella brassicae]|uniref:Uncharacterized protein n=1 Tax=Terasakiella brassicae TaxID=1634917 RepID=A0A917C7Q1_9PROT|nr:hypothetical protein [Terasakiella brassicae]GGF74435.1 hypothetical protein GCM10011332_30700 [Terasakiella brassicae]